MSSSLFTNSERKTMLDMVAQMYFAFKQNGIFSATNYYDLPNGRYTQTDLTRFSNEDLVSLINLHFDLKIQRYLPNANLNSETCNYSEKCGIARTLIDWYQRGIPLQDIVLQERKRLQDDKLKSEMKSQKQSQRQSQRHTIFDRKSVVTDYCAD